MSIQKLKMFAAMAAMMAGGIGSSDSSYDLRMRKKDSNKPGPSKEVKEARKRQKKARKQNRGK